MRQAFFILVVSALWIVPLWGKAQNNNAKEEYERFRQQAHKDYADFRKQCNEKYARFLKEAWESYKAGPVIPKPKDETVPPVVMPIEEQEKPVVPKPVPIDTVVAPPVIEEPKPQPKPVAPIYEVPTPVVTFLEFQFFGADAKVRVPTPKSATSGSGTVSSTNDLPAALIRVNSDVSGDAISAAWQALSNGDYDNLVRDCLELRIRYGLCDWAYLLLTRQLAEKYLDGQTNAATMLAAWVYCQSGYQMKFGSVGGQLFMLVGTKHMIYDMVGYTLGNEEYYVIVDKGQTAPTTMQICNADFPGQQPMSLYLPQAQKFPDNLSPVRTIKSEHYPDVSITVEVNKNLLDFYNTYPTSVMGENVCSRWAMYANTPMAKNIVDNTYPQLRNAISGKSQLDAANILLNWIQTGMVYEYDDKVWGGDRAFFPEETLYYPYCDCEDRAILYTRLVRDLLGLKCLLVFYPGHLAAAVCFSEPVSGDWIEVGGNKYTITDPTYINAPVGYTMPDMNNQTAQVIVLE